MEYRVLGPLEVRDGERSLPLAGAKQRALLALLLVNANRVVSRDWLVDQLWGDRPPETAVQSLQVYVSRLRKLLPPETLLTRPPGYLLEVEADELDLQRFERLLAQGREALDAGEAKRAASVLHAALGLWRGSALAEFAFEPFAQAEIGRLEDLRLAAVEERVEADLALGRHGDLIGELEALIAENPHRERLRGHLMLALYRSGRQAEALAAYQAARAALVDELGIDPSTELQQLEKQILTQDKELDLPPRPRPVAPAPLRHAPLRAPEPAPEHGAPSVEPFTRKTVTVLFCDVTGFTSLGERVDPETMRRVMLHYFDEMRTVLERHGGNVEKFIGDAVMAVFGVPVVHEDDALRAVRAADEMRLALTRLNLDLDERFGVRLEARIGINTGEVVVGDPTAQHTIATGDAINVAARLQQAAQPGEILLGRETYRLVSDRVRAGPLETFVAKGKSEPLSSWRLDEVRAGAERMFRRLDSPIVGRERERDVLHAAYRSALDEQACRLVTVLGAAGVGKTRLAQEVAARSFGAAIAQGRCLPYGDGISFFPVTEVLRSIAGLAADDDEQVVRGRIAQLLPAGDESALVTDRLAGVLGGDPKVRAEEAFWAVRRLLESVARSRPLVLVLEDLHWAEPTLLDFVEYLVGWSHGAPMLVLVLARPDLLDLRPGWPGERLMLEPLDGTEVRALLTNLLGAAELDAKIAERIEHAAEGNPLFVEELVRMLIDDEALVLDDGRWVARDVGELAIPPSISALLAARLDHLEPEEQVVLQCASVIGKQFWWSAVAELAPAEIRDRVGTHLHALVRKRLVFPAESTSFANEDSLRFGHILVRDAAYAALPKSHRAELHEQFAGWLARKGAYEEIRGHHLDQAYAFRRELGMLDEDTKALGVRAGTLLASAGGRSFAREDMHAAARFLTRAVELLPEGGPRREAMRDLSAALWVVGEHERADSVLEHLLERAAQENDRRIEWYGRLERAGRRDTRAEAPAEALETVARDAIRVFDELEDDLGLARAWRRIAYAAERRCSFAAAAEASERALVHVKRVGAAQDEARVVDRLCMALLYGPAHVTDAMRRCDELLRSARPNLLTEANVLGALSGLRAMAGEFDAARAAYHRAREIYDELGLRLLAGSLAVISGPVELAIGNAAAAEAELRFGVEIMREVGFSRALGEDAALLAAALLAQGKREEAAELLEISRSSASSADVAAQVLWRAVHARLEGDEQLARDAVALSDETDALSLQGDARASLAEVLEAAGASDDARSERERARELYEKKGNIAAASLLATARVLGSR